MIEKLCIVCNAPLKLNNTRDLSRKRFCCRSHANSYTSKNRISNLPIKKCKVCGIDFKPKNSVHNCCTIKCSSKLQVERSYKYLNNNIEGYIRHLLCRKDRGNIPLEYIMELYSNQDGKCALSNIELTFIKKTDGIKVHTNLSIDRIDSNKGYEIGNTQLVCAIVNIMKSTLTVPELKWWCQQIVEGG